MSLMCYQASVPGTSHLALGVPNQDSFAVRRLRSSWSSSWSSSRAEPRGAWAHPACGGEFVVAAVADGLGSAELSELGSAVAAATVTNELSLFVAEHPDLDEIGDLVLEGAMHRALAAVNCKAAEVGADPAALATTLALCVWDGYGVAWACAGDSGIVGLFADGYRPLCRMDRKGHRNTVFSLSADDHWRFGVAEGVEGLVLATDGMLEQLVPGFVTPVSGADVDLADVEVNDLLLDLLLRLDPADAAAPMIRAPPPRSSSATSTRSTSMTTRPWSSSTRCLSSGRPMGLSTLIRPSSTRAPRTGLPLTSSRVPHLPLTLTTIPGTIPVTRPSMRRRSRLWASPAVSRIRANPLPSPLPSSRPRPRTAPSRRLRWVVPPVPSPSLAPQSPPLSTVPFRLSSRAVATVASIFAVSPAVPSRALPLPPRR